MVSPEEKSQKADSECGDNHRPIAEYRYSRQCGDHFGNQAHSRQDRYVYLGVTEKPEEVLPQQWGAASMRNRLITDHQMRRHEKACPPVTIQEKKNSCRE